jgi:DNA transposition AAA+ family ATPase
MKNETVPIKGITDSLQCFKFLLNSTKEQMGLIIGPSGVGKTTALTLLAQQYGALYFSCYPSMSKFFLISRLCSLYSIESPRSIANGLDLLAEGLASVRKPLLIDEADFLFARRELLDLIRVLHDQARIPVVFCGMTGIYEKFSQIPLLVDRIQYFLEIAPMSLSDCQLLIESIADVQIESDLIERIFKESKGKARLVWRMISHLENWALDHGLPSISLKDLGNGRLLPEGSEPPSKVVGMRRYA